MSVIESLLEYQNVDRELKKLEKEVVNTTEGKNLLQVKSNGKKLLEEIAVQDKKCAEIIKRFNELDKKLEKLKNELSEYDEVVDDISSPEQSEYCLKKITDLIAQIEEINKQIDSANKLMEQTLNNAEKLIEKHNKNNIDRVEKEKLFKDVKLSYYPKVKELNTKLAELKTSIPDDIIEKYQNLRNRGTKFPLVAELNDNAECLGCFLEAKGAEVYLKEHPDVEIAECPSCGRLVYKKK